MEVIVSRFAGFCDGVERAFEIVKKIALDPTVKKPIYVLGSLVHNNDVVREIEKMGVNKIKVPENLEDIFKQKNPIGTLVITAHGMGPEIYALAKRQGVDIIDTTCPKVIKVQRLAKVFSKRNAQLIVVGDRKHKEVDGICQWAKNKALRISEKKDLNEINLNPKKSIAVIAQTTQNSRFFLEIVEILKQKYPNVEIIDTICLATQNRQQEAEKIAREAEAVIVLGSSESANSTRLWEISRQINSRSYFVENASQIDPGWFVGVRKVGLTAGASVPPWIIQEAKEYLEKF